MRLRVGRLRDAGKKGWIMIRPPTNGPYGDGAATKVATPSTAMLNVTTWCPVTCLPPVGVGALQPGHTVPGLSDN